MIDDDDNNGENHFKEGEDPLNPLSNNSQSDQPLNNKLPEKKKPYQSKKKVLDKANKLQPLLSDNFQSKIVDKSLYFVIAAVEISLLEVFQIPHGKLTIEEARYDKTFVYYFENNNNGLSGYIGRDKNDNNKILYVIKDNARLKWAKMEGFLDYDQSQLFVYEQIGIFRRAKSINDFMIFLSGKPEYELIGKYLVG